MNIVDLMSSVVQNAVQAKFVASQLGLPEELVDKAVDIIVTKRKENEDVKTASSLAAFDILKEYRAFQERQFDKQPNELLVQCKACRTINKVRLTS